MRCVFDSRWTKKLFQRKHKMKKFAVFSGFLGSGKTSTMMALTKLSHKTAMITNDLGGPGLADNRLAKLEGCNAFEFTGDCICYQNEKLAQLLDELFAAGFELVISDIPGFGVGALEHVYHGLEEKFPGVCELAPFTVLVEPRTVKLLREGYDKDMAYILNTQLVEADLIVLNKCDSISADEREACESWLRGHYPGAEILSISAASEDNIQALSDALTKDRASMRRPDIGYGGEAFSKIMEQVCEYNLAYYATVCCNSFDGNAYLMALAEAVKAAVRAEEGEMPHMKILSWQPEGEYAKLDMLGTGHPVEVNRRFTQPCTELAVLLNSSAFGIRAALDKAITAAVERVSEEFQLEVNIFKKELI